MVKKKVPPKSHYHILKKKWLKRHKTATEKLHATHQEALEWINEKLPAKEKLASSAVGALMLTNTLPAAVSAVSASQNGQEEATVVHVDTKEELSGYFATSLPSQMRPLTDAEEAEIGQRLSRDYGMNVSATLDGKRLNRSYGYIGAEQHLMRYPGDTMASHLAPEVSKNKIIYSSGMAPGRGAWGYFAKSKADMTNKDIEREKYYIAVQTFLSPGFLDNVHDRYNWFKFRKMIVVNPKTGQAVVCVIGDAGPAQWTGKHLGGSPEVMYELGLHTGPRKGGVLYFFVDDVDDKIPLGPINLGGI